MRTLTNLVLASILTLGIAGTATAGGPTAASGPTAATGPSARPALPALRLFGQTWCFGSTPGVRCDVTLPVATAAPAPASQRAAQATPPHDDGFLSRVMRAARAQPSG